KAQIRGLNVATGNCQEGMNLFQTMDGGLAEIHDVLQRMRELAVRAANEATLTQSDRDKLQNEVASLRKQITQIAESTTFNTKHVLIGNAQPGDYRVAFESLLNGNYELYSLLNDGSDQQQITNTGTNEGNACWSPDGTKIAYNIQSGGTYDIYTINSDGTNSVNLTNSGSQDLYPDWSPDGSKIAFTRITGPNIDVYVMDADGSNVINITNSVTRDMMPTWSPDGSRIVFARMNGPDSEIVVMNADGSNAVNISNNPAWDQDPTWSPDGSKIAFWTNRDGNVEVYVMDSDGANPVNITNNGASDMFPTWSPDSSEVLFVSDRGGNNEIYAVNADGTNIRNVTSNGSSNYFPSCGSPTDKSFLQVGPDNGTNYRIDVDIPNATAFSLGVNGVDVSSVTGAQTAIAIIDNAINAVSDYRKDAGIARNGVERIVNDNMMAQINISGANSRIEDADVALEITALTKIQILNESTLSMSMQSNPESTMALDLI
ncbi:MAG: PD40 domain-containing protein, partial [Victivallales bacterium]|nr:PD40 domain-containing protein [Victivallales bacterium]